MKSKHSNKELFKAASQATVACLVPCIVGELVAILIGLTFGLCTCSTIIIAVILIYILAILWAVTMNLRNSPVRDNSSLLVDNSDRAVSISIIMIVLNYCVYHLNITCISSLLSLSFFIGFPIAIGLAYIAALPINFWMIMQDIDARS